MIIDITKKLEKKKLKKAKDERLLLISELINGGIITEIVGIVKMADGTYCAINTPNKKEEITLGDLQKQFDEYLEQLDTVEE